MVLHLLQSYRGVHSPCVFVCIVFSVCCALFQYLVEWITVLMWTLSILCNILIRSDLILCALYTPLPQNKHRVITPIQLKWMDCYEMICVNPKTTINEMFCVVSLHTISFPCLLVCLFFRNSMKLIFFFSSVESFSSHCNPS